MVARENRKPRKNARVPLPPPSDDLKDGAPPLFNADLSSFLVQRMQEGGDSDAAVVTLDGPVITEEVMDTGDGEEGEELSIGAGMQNQLLNFPPSGLAFPPMSGNAAASFDETITNMSTLEVITA